MSKIEREAKQYENVSDFKLKRVIFWYKFLSFSNKMTFNFIISLIFTLVPYFIICDVTIFSFLLIILLHYIVFWKYLYEHKNIKMVSDEDRYEIDQVLKILNQYLLKRKNPS